MFKTERDKTLDDSKNDCTVQRSMFKALCEYASEVEERHAAERRTSIARTEQCEMALRASGNWQARYNSLVNDIKALASSLKVSP